MIDVKVAPRADSPCIQISRTNSGGRHNNHYQSFTESKPLEVHSIKYGSKKRNWAVSLEIFKLFVKYHIKDILMNSAKGIQSLVFEKLPFPQTSSHFSDGFGQHSQTHGIIFWGVLFRSKAK